MIDPAPPTPPGPNSKRETAFLGALAEERTDAAISMPSRKRRVRLPMILFLATCVSTFMAGMGFSEAPWSPPPSGLETWEVLVDRLHVPAGVHYMAALMGILLAHEMGHFLQAVRYRIPASLPYFIPIPLHPFGTMGAVIGMDGLKANRRELFDLGISGPLAGLVVALPIIYFGVLSAPVAPLAPPGEVITYHDPLLVKLVIQWFRPDVPPGRELLLTPLLAAGWVGMLITGLNMMPISQLDGGHVIYGLFGHRGNWLARAFFVAAIAYILIAEAYVWTTMLVIVTLLGPDHPPTANDHVTLGPVRWILGLASLSIPFLCFPLEGITFGR